MSRLFAMLTISALGMCMTVWAQTGHRVQVHAPETDVDSNGPYQDDVSARDLYVKYNNPSKRERGRPGAKVRFELLRNGVLSFVPVNTEFRAGDKVKFHFAVNFPASVSIINQGSSGQRRILFPYNKRNEVVARSNDYVVPPERELWFQFDRTPGVERLTFIFSSASLLSASGRSYQQQEEMALDDLIAGALDNGRDLVLAQVTNEECYVVSDEQRLRKPVGFQINLKHK